MWKHLSSLASSCSFFVFSFFFFFHVSYFISASGQKIRHFLDSSRGGKRMTQSNEHCSPSGKKFQLYLIDYNHVYATCVWVCVCACTRVLSRVLFFATSKPTRLLCPWDFSGKNTGVGYHFLLQGIFPTQESKSHSVVTVHPDSQTVFLQDLLLASRFWWLLLSPLVYPVWVLIMSAWGDLASLLTLQSRDSRRIHRWFFRCCYGGQLCDQHTLSRLITFLLSESSY